MLRRDSASWVEVRVRTGGTGTAGQVSAAAEARTQDEVCQDKERGEVERVEPRGSVDIGKQEIVPAFHRVLQPGPDWPPTPARVRKEARLAYGRLTSCC